MSIPGDLSGDSFRDANLAGAHLTVGGGGPSDYQGLDFSGANLSGASFTGQWIQGVPTAIEGALFKGANLSSSSFINVAISDCNFTNAILNRVVFTKADIIGSNFKKAQISIASNSLVSQGQNFGTPVISPPYKFVNGEFVWSPPSITSQVTGLLKVGGFLTAVLGPHKLEGSPTYQWLMEGTPISGPQTNTLNLTPDTVGHSISVAIRITDAQNRVVEAISSPTAPVLSANVIKAKTFKITGTAAYGRTLTAKPTLLLAGATLSYKWYLDGKLITTAKSSSWKVMRSAVGKSLTVKVTETLSGYGSYSKTSTPTRIN
jgi:hypothetical protein